ncbi:MAG: helix-turn-helix domain-containing protein [Sedimenticola sp.]
MKYGTDALEEAMKAVSAGMSVRKAAQTFGVPKSTIGDRVSGKHELHVQHGRPPAVPATIENKLVETVKTAAGLSRKQIIIRTNVLCKRIKITSSYTNFHAGKDWWEGVKRRHPDLVVRKPEKLTSLRARMLNGEVVSKYFEDLNAIIQDLNLTQRPACIWNCDESGVNFEHSPVKVVAQKGDRNVVSKTTSKSSNITVMACVNAEGNSMPPMFVTKGKTNRCLHGFNTNEAPKGSVWTFQKNGWMNDEIGEKWFEGVFLKHCGPHRPQILILDGHSSHETLTIIEKAIEENISILSLPPHSTHYLQPLDRSVFGALKTVYNQNCSDFMQEHPLHVINKWTFPTLFSSAWEKTVTAANIRSGFKACGIFPFNEHAVPLSAFAPSEPTNLTSPDVSREEITNTPEYTATPISPQNPSTFADQTSSNTEYDDHSVDTLPVIDLSDPTTLAKFLEVDTSKLYNTDNKENNIDLLDNLEQNETTHSPIHIYIKNDDSCASVNPTADFENIESLFLPEKIITRPQNTNRNKSAQTKHRLLTSDEIVCQKRAKDMKRKTDTDAKLKKSATRKKPKKSNN